ncbi:MAG TPA: glycosyltransferase [Pyrinomonadaceae bacterium]|nr:glycosyltransferase [Pyrinomonadaceae bacterium]
MKVIRVIARLNVGGPARHVVWLTAGLHSIDCETVLVAGSVPAGEDDMSYFASQHGVTPVYIQEMSREISFKDLISVGKLYRLFLRERPDIIHTHTAKAGTVGRFAALLYRWSTTGAFLGRPRPCKVVHTYHGHIFHSYYGPLKTRLFILIERVLARLGTDRIVVVSTQQREEINNTFAVGSREQFAVIPLGLDLSLFSSWRDCGRKFREEIGAKRDDILIGIVGRMTEVKNHQLFFEAVQLFKKSDSTKQSLRFVIIGDGALRQELENQVERLALKADVIFAGNRTDPEDFYPALDVVALTSRNEGTPLTLLEAMANARPIIATDVGGVTDLLGEVTCETQDGFSICQRGLRVPSGNAQGFAAGLARLIGDSNLRSELGERGLEFVEQNYSKERLLNDVSSLYRELMEALNCQDLLNRQDTKNAKKTNKANNAQKIA